MNMSKTITLITDDYVDGKPNIYDEMSFHHP